MVPGPNSFSPVDGNSLRAETPLKQDDEGRLGPAQIRDKRPHIPRSRGQGDLPDYTLAERLPGGQKGRDATPQ